MRPLLTLALAALAATGAAAQPAFSKAFDVSTIAPGSISTLTFQIDNRDFPGQPAQNLAFVDNLPGGMTVATPSGATTTCAGDRGLAIATLTADEGSGTITFSDGQIGGGAVCTATVNVTVGAAGTYVNTTSDLTSSAGNSGSASATLTASDAAPRFSKAFSPGTILPDGRSTLTFTIDNSASDNFSFSGTFADPLPEGVTLADPVNLVSTCQATVTAEPGASQVQVFSNFLNSGQTCTIQVDVTASLPGRAENLTTNYTSSSGSSGKAGAVLTVAETGRLAANVTFTNDPVQPGGQVQALFRVFNRDRSRTYTDISFTDDFGATLAGLATSGDLPDDPCGPGSSLVGGSTLVLTGGQLAAGESCAFRVTLDVPAGAAGGVYPNQTSPPTALADGTPIGGSPGAGELIVTEAPTLTLEYVEGVVAPGDRLTLRYTIANPSATSAATGIAFTDTFSDAFPDPLPLAEPLPNPACNGTLFQSNGDLSLVSGSLDPGASCTFDVVLALPDGFPGGTYTTQPGRLTAAVDGTTQSSTPDPATFRVLALPTLAKTFQSAAIPGGTVALVFRIRHSANATAPATQLAFTDDLDAVLSGLAATGLPADGVCGPGSQLAGTSTLQLTGGSLQPGETCEFGVELAVPASAPAGTFTNVTSELSAVVGGTPYTQAPAQADLLVSPLRVQKEFTDDPVAPGGTVTLEYTLANNASAGPVTNVQFSDPLSSALSGLQSTSGPLADVCGAGSQVFGTTTLFVTGASLQPGQSCTFSVTLAVPGGAASGPYVSRTSAISGTYQSASFSLPGGVDVLEVSTGDVPVFSKAFSPSTIAPGGVSRLTFTIDNTVNAEAASELAFTDLLPEGLVVASPSNASTTCTGGTLTTASQIEYDAGAVPAGASCTVSVDVTAAEPGTYVNVSSPLTSSFGVSPEAQATLEVGGVSIVATKTDAILIGNEDEVADAGETIRYTIVVRNDGGETAADVSLFDAPDENTTLVNGSVTTTQGTVTSGNSSGDEAASVLVGDVAAGQAVTVTLDVVVTPLVEEPPPICNQARLNYDGRDAVTDDPDTPGVDATCTPTDQPPVDLVVTSFTAARGAAVVPRGTLENTTDDAITVQLRILVEDPDGATETYLTRKGTLEPNQLSRPIPLGRVPIASDAPAGEYTVTVTVRRTAGNELLDDETFTFELEEDPAVAAAQAAAVEAGVEPGAAPNPFRTATAVRFALEAASEVDLRVYDVTGREVAVLLDGPREAGVHRATFEAAGRPAGVYVWRLSVDGAVTVGRVTLVR